jgi:hypothetical protein
MWKKGIHESEEHKKKISEILNESKVIEKINRFLFDTR